MPDPSDPPQNPPQPSPQPDPPPSPADPVGEAKLLLLEAANELHAAIIAQPASMRDQALLSLAETVQIALGAPVATPG